MLLVLIGGGIGSLLRFLSVLAIGTLLPVVRYPISTFAVNVVGCFVMGVVVGLSTRSLASENIRLFLSTGILGGFTTFSAFGLEIAQLARGEEVLVAGIYAIASVVCGCAAVFDARSRFLQ
jgi:fluoride exporter